MKGLFVHFSSHPHEGWCLREAVPTGSSACNSVWSWQQEAPKQRKGCLPSDLCFHNVAYHYRAYTKQLFCLTGCHIVRACFAGRPCPQMLCNCTLQLFVLPSVRLGFHDFHPLLIFFFFFDVAMVTFMVRVFAHEIKSWKLQSPFLQCDLALFEWCCCGQSQVEAQRSENSVPVQRRAKLHLEKGQLGKGSCFKIVKMIVYVH